MTEPPKGLLATAALAAQATIDVLPSEVPAPTPSDAPIDPNYFEPTPLVKLRDITTKLSQLPDEELKMRDDQRGKFINVLLDRIHVLEGTLLPFAQIGMVLSNARLCLRGAGKSDEPCGGHWINQVTSVHMAQTEHHFFLAIDAVGRKRTEEHMMDVFTRLRAAQALMAEQKVHIDAGGLVQ